MATAFARAMILPYQDASTDIFFITEGSVRSIIYAPAGKALLFRDTAVSTAGVGRSSGAKPSGVRALGPNPPPRSRGCLSSIGTV